MRALGKEYPPSLPLKTTDNLYIMRQSFVAICEYNGTAAALLSYFHYWYEKKRNHYMDENGIDFLEDIPKFHRSFLQYNTYEELYEKVLFKDYSVRTIKRAIKYLVQRGFIEIYKNEKDPRDRTNHYLFKPDKVSKALLEYYQTASHNASQQNDTMIMTNDTDDRECQNNPMLYTKTTQNLHTKTTKDIEQFSKNFENRSYSRSPFPILMDEADITVQDVIEDFKKRDDLKIADAKFYFDVTLDWSRAKAVKKKDWLAQVRNIARSDMNRGKLKTMARKEVMPWER